MKKYILILGFILFSCNKNEIIENKVISESIKPSINSTIIEKKDEIKSNISDNCIKDESFEKNIIIDKDNIEKKDIEKIKNLKINEKIRAISSDKNFEFFSLKSEDENIIKIEPNNVLVAKNYGKTKIKIISKSCKKLEKEIEITIFKHTYISINDSLDDKYLFPIKDFPIDEIPSDKNIFTYRVESDDRITEFYFDIKDDFGKSNKTSFIFENSNNNILEIDNKNKIILKNYGKSRIKVTNKEDKSFYFTFDVEYKESFVEIFNNDEIDCYKQYKPERYEFFYNIKSSNTDYIRYQDVRDFYGNIYDTKGNPAENILVTVKSIDPYIKWGCFYTFTDKNGYYKFYDGPAGARLEIKAKKENWTTRTRTEVIKTNFDDEPNMYKFDFGNGGKSETDFHNLYAIQDEPEVTEIKINGKYFTDSDTGSTLGLSTRNPDIVPGVNLNTIEPKNIKLELNFSEKVIKEDIENYFRIISTSKFSDKTQSFTLTKKDFDFFWKSDTELVITLLKELKANNLNEEEARYLIYFEKPFRDLANNEAIKNRYFKFSASKINDFTTFSVKK
ncbi:MAG: carboxypeptidase-like regulatory domain-containing protein [Candidatus Sericytochromatia bacterium]